MAKVFSVDMDKQRLDSTHIFSNMKHLGRIGLFVQTIEDFLTNLKRKQLYAALDTDLASRYMSKKGFYLRYTARQVRIAVRRAYEKTDEFRQRYRWRAGIEGSNALGKQKTGVGKLRVRGMKAVRFAVTLKWLGGEHFKGKCVSKG
ncbi:MAG: transposase [Mariprofundus sp.]|nr:transposase [Mariprofundus sp.]